MRTLRCRREKWARQSSPWLNLFFLCKILNEAMDDDYFCCFVVFCFVRRSPSETSQDDALQAGRSTFLTCSVALYGPRWCPMVSAWLDGWGPCMFPFRRQSTVCR